MLYPVVETGISTATSEGQGNAEGVPRAEIESSAEMPTDARTFSGLSRVDESQYPWRAVVRLEIEHNELPSNQIFVCSGFLIDPKVVLTRGNCVFNHSSGYGWATNVRVIPAYENGVEPYGDAQDTQIASVTGWTQDQDYDYDYGFVVLDRPIGNLTGWGGYAWDSNNSFFTTTTFQNPGYPDGGSYNLRLMYNRSGKFDTVETFRLYRNGGSDSMSGSAAIFPTDNDYRVVGILSHTRGGGSETGYTRITEAKFDAIQAKIAEHTPSSPDLVPLVFRTSSTTLLGGTSPAMSFYLYNHSSTNWTGTLTYKVYVSSNNIISDQDTLIGTHTYNGSIDPKLRKTVTVPATTIPGNLSGSYYIGVVLSINDADTGNNATIEQDAQAVTISQPLTMSASPTTLSYKGALGTSLGSRTVSITKSGDGSFNWTASANRTWIVLSRTSGTSSGSFSASINTSGLAAGLHSGQITISAPGATPSSVAIPVTVELTKPGLTTTAGPLSFSAAVDGTPPPAQNLQIQLSDSSQLAWTASTLAAWLVLDQSSGTGTDTIGVSVNVTGLAAGLYDGQITVNAPGANPESQVVDVKLDLTPPAIVSPSPSLVFQVVAGSGPSEPQDLAFSFEPAGQFAWTAAAGADWITVSPTEGVGATTIAVSVDPTGFGPETYGGMVTIEFQADLGATPKSIPIWMEVTRGSGVLTVAPPSLSFVALAGENPPAPQAITIGDENSEPFAWTISPNRSWLVLDDPTGQTPGSPQVAIDHAGLDAGTYTGAITVWGPESGEYDEFEQPILISSTVTVTLDVGARNGGVPLLQVAPQSLAYSARLGADPPPAQTLLIENVGGGVLNWEATSDSSWIVLDPTTGTDDGALQVRVDTAGLGAGVHSGQIRLRGNTASEQVVNVLLTLARPPTLAVDGKTLVFTAIVDEASPPPATFTMRNSGGGDFSWTATEAIPWLSLSQSSGTPPATVSAQVDPAAVGPGRHTGVIVVTAAADGSPQTINASLYVQPGPELGLSRSALRFDALAGETLANIGSFDIKNTSQGQLNWRIEESIPWLSLSQSSGSVAAFSRQTLQVSVNAASLLPSATPYSGSITVVSNNGGGSPQTIHVALTVASKAR